MNYTNIFDTFLKSVHVSATGTFKSSILFGGWYLEDTIEVIKNVLDVTSSDFEEKYLGLPTPDGRLTKGKLQNSCLLLMGILHGLAKKF